jgi:N-acetyltransferase
MPSNVDKSELRGLHVGLVPLSNDHASDLIKASGDALPISNWFTRATVPSAGTMMAEINKRLAAFERGSGRSFTIMAAATGRPVGLISYENIDAENRRLEIGEPWLHRFQYSSPATIECYLLAIEHAFVVLGCVAVEFRVHWQDESGRKKLDRLGAKLDATLRNGEIMSDGTLADIAVYSIIASEWRDVRKHLEQAVES